MDEKIYETMTCTLLCRYRAIIEAVEPEIKIRFIDFGDTLVVPKENLAPLPPSLFSLHPLVSILVNSFPVLASISFLGMELDF